MLVEKIGKSCDVDVDVDVKIERAGLAGTGSAASYSTIFVPHGG
jgi:hypothetical protein